MQMAQPTAPLHGSSIPHGTTCRLEVISTSAKLFMGAANQALSEVLIEGAIITLPAGDTAHAFGCFPSTWLQAWAACLNVPRKHSRVTRLKERKLAKIPSQGTACSQLSATKSSSFHSSSSPAAGQDTDFLHWPQHFHQVVALAGMCVACAIS